MMVGQPSDPTPRVNDFRPGGSNSAMHVSGILRAVRRHLPLVLFVAGATAGAVLAALQEPAQYRAIAMLRLAGERRQTSAGVEGAAPLLDRTIDPLLSLVPRIRSRAIVGPVVDSLGLQLRWVPQTSGWLSLRPPILTAVALSGVQVSPAAPGDTLRFVFATGSVRVQGGSKWLEAPYGTPIELGGVQFEVPQAPALSAADLAIISRDLAIDRTLDRLMVVPVVGTDAIEVQFVDSDPAVARSVANSIVSTFRTATIQSSRDQASRRRLFLADQVREADRLLARAQGNLSAFQRRQQMANSSDRIAVRQAALLSVDARRSELDADRRAYQSTLAQLEGPDDSTQAEGLRTLAYSPEIAAHPVAGRLYQELIGYRTRLDSLTTGPWRSTASNPDVVHLTGRLQRSQRELVGAVRAHLRSIEQRSKALEDIQQVNVDSIQALPAIQAEESRLNQQLASLATLADQLRLEYQKSRMSEELQVGDIEVVDLAALPDRPIGVPGWLKLGVALIAGSLLGSALALALDLRNRSIRDPEELARILPVRGLGIIPRVDEAAVVGPSLAALRHRLNGNGHVAGAPEGVVGDSQPPSIGAESFRLLYSSLTFGWGGRPRVILVTSVAPKEGKTLVASNLAVTFAREGARVLLVDCDLRRPRIHRIFHLKRSPGLTDLLRTRFPGPAPRSPAAAPEASLPGGGSYSMMPGAERHDARDDLGRVAQPTAERAPTAAASSPLFVSRDLPSAIKSSSIRGLSVLPCGDFPPNPAEALNAGGIRAMLEAWAEHFDVVIIDTPPVLVTADAAILAPSADGVLLVIRAGQTDRTAAERAYEQLAAAGAPVLGTVLNDPAGEVARYRKLYYSYDYPATPD